MVWPGEPQLLAASMSGGAFSMSVQPELLMPLSDVDACV
jgi:hypothetical protein